MVRLDPTLTGYVVEPPSFLSFPSLFFGSSAEESDSEVSQPPLSAESSIDLVSKQNFVSNERQKLLSARPSVHINR